MTYQTAGEVNTMTTRRTITKTKRAMTFEDLRGLRAEGYIRDSTLDQRDGFGPEMQRRATENFARTYGLVLGQAWYTDFITGTSTLKRSGFRQALADAQTDRFDVLLVYHTSRFARNRADAIRYKNDLRNSGKVLVFVSQGIISGNNNDFLNEAINEVLDEHYSRVLSNFVTDGLRLKHEQGIANGVPPLGYNSEKLDNGKRERKVPDFNGLGGDPKKGGMEALLALLRGYASGQYSYQTLADHLNAEGYRNREGQFFTKGSVEHVLSNRFYEGKAVYHPDEPDEEVRDGNHKVPEEVKKLWLQCQEVKARQRRTAVGGPRRKYRAYPFSRVAECGHCGGAYTGKPAISRRGEEIRRLVHTFPRCDLKPYSVSLDAIEAQWRENVLPYIELDNCWRTAVMASIHENNRQDGSVEKKRLERALENLRKEHLWGDLSDESYREERTALERRVKALALAPTTIQMPNLDRAATLLNDLPVLWSHPGVTDQQREALVDELLEKAVLLGQRIIAIEPKSAYKPLFAYLAVNRWKNRLVEPTRPTS